MQFLSTFMYYTVSIFFIRIRIFALKLDPYICSLKWRFFFLKKDIHPIPFIYKDDWLCLVWWRRRRKSILFVTPFCWFESSIVASSVVSDIVCRAFFFSGWKCCVSTSFHSSYPSFGTARLSNHGKVLLWCDSPGVPYFPRHVHVWY